MLAWLATTRATDAALPIDSEYAPASAASRTSSLNGLARNDSRAEKLAKRYRERVHYLHDACLHGGFCGPEIDNLIRATDQYIIDAALLGASRMSSQ